VSKKTIKRNITRKDMGKDNQPEEVVHVYVCIVLRVEVEGEDEKENE
jgi:hypothetical protein